jgi:hypothetical protein
VAPVIEIITPLDGSSFSWMDQLTGEARAYDPDNVDPLNCQPIGSFTANNGDGIQRVEFRIEHVDGGGAVVHEQVQSVVRYCAFTGTGTCLTWSFEFPGPKWPNDTSASSGLHRLKARALDDEGVHSEWVYVEFTLDIDPTPTPTPTATASNTPTPVTPTAVPCSVYSLGGFGFSPPGGNDVWWTLSNGAAAVEIQWITVEWSVSGNLEKIKLAGNDIWGAGLSTSPANITGPWIGADPPVLDPGNSELRLTFENLVVGGTFSITVHLSGGCSPASGTGVAS